MLLVLQPLSANASVAEFVTAEKPKILLHAIAIVLANFIASHELARTVMIGAQHPRLS